jgi:hypothetical protein
MERLITSVCLAVGKQHVEEHNDLLSHAEGRV